MSVLPDVLADGLAIVFCGTAAGRVSAQRGAYYSGPGNKFWPTLHRVGITPHQLDPADFRKLLDYRVGLTDLAQHTSGSDYSLRPGDFVVDELTRKIEHHQPRLLCFNGKKAGKEYLHTSSVDYGEQSQRIGQTRLFVLPSTSGAANAYWDESWWQKVAALGDPGMEPEYDFSSSIQGKYAARIPATRDEQSETPT
ncbi:MAG: mismatch-specific DNA-glycosylase [Planctomycetota bacterium]